MLTAEVLGRLLVLQQVVLSLPDVEGIAAFLARAMSEIPGVRTAAVCLQGKMTPPHHFRPCRSCGKKSCDYRDGDGLAVFPISAFGQSPACLLLELAEEVLFTPYRPFISNIFQVISSELARRENQQRLEQAREKAEASNRELQAFAYVLSHDLQEPLRMVYSYLQLIERRCRDRLQPEEVEYIGFAVDGAERMSKMIKGLLAYSRVESQGKPFAQTDLGTMLNEALANLRLVIEESAAKISHGRLPTVAADARQMGRLLQNLISNALKFRSDTPPRIQVEAVRHGEEWVISVADNGIGIPPGKTEHIFTMFQRLHTREEYPGLGIGLAVCKRIVERHGGRIWVESKQGEGACFYFSLPTVKS